MQKKKTISVSHKFVNITQRFRSIDWLIL